MKKIYVFLFFSIFMLFGTVQKGYSQCNLTTSTMYATTTAPTDCTTKTITTSAYMQEPVSVTGVVAGNTYLFTVVNSTSTQYPTYTFNMYIGATAGTAPTSFVTSATAPVTATPLTITYTATASGTIALQLLDANCTASGSGHGLNTITVKCISCAGSAATVTQPSTAATLQGTFNNQVLRLDIPSCGVSNISSVTFGTTGSTNAVTDIVQARVYYTTSTSFSTTTQFGTAINNPNGSFTVTGTQSIADGATGYFWLVYDIPCTATVTDVVDAEVTSYTSNSTAIIPATTNPTGTRAIGALYAPARTDGNSTTAISTGAVNAQMVYAAINSSAACPASATSVTFNVSGTSPATDITSAKCFYTTSTTFSSATPFGTAISNPAAGTVTFTGTQSLTAGANYFWLVYDISCAAVNANTVNGDVVSVSVGGVPYTATGTATAANAISAPVVATSQPATSAVTAGTVNAQVLRVDVPASSCIGNITQLNFTNASTNIADISKARVYYTTSTTFSAAAQFGSDVIAPGSSFSVTGSQASAASGTNYFWLVYDIACSAPSTAGNTTDASVTGVVSSIIGTLTATTPNPTGTRSLTAFSNPTVSTTQSSTSSVASGTANAQIMSVSLAGSACLSSITQLNFTNASTNAADIAKARVYYTTTSTFSTTTQFGSDVTSPGASFSVTGTLTPATSGTLYFWLVYDIACGAPATAGNVADASFTGIVTNLGTLTAATANPTGTRTITALYASARSDGNGTTAINPGILNNRMAYVNVTGSASCPGTVSNVQFTVSGTAPSTDIVSAKCYYTTTTTFSTANPFGSAVLNPAAGAINFTGSQALASATGNYFWLVYDISCSATSGNSVNGDITSLTINSSTVTPTGTATAANNIATATSYTTVADGEWSNSATWACGTIPPTNATAITVATNVTVSNTGNIGGSVTINSGASLTVNAGGDLTLGTAGGGNRTFTNNGTLTVTGGNLNVNGNVVIANTSSLNQSGGTISIDGNAAGVVASSVAAGTPIFSIGTSSITFSTGTVTLTGGSIVIVDPHTGSTSSDAAFTFYGAAIANNITAGPAHILQFGDGVSTDAGGGTGGFIVNEWETVGGFKPNIVVNTGTGVNRIVSPRYTPFVLGGLKIISGELAGATLTTVEYDLEVNSPGILTMASGTTLFLGKGTFTSSTSVTTSAGAVAQTIKGDGIIRNATSAETANLVALTINNTSPSGVTLQRPISISGAFLLTAGLLKTTQTNLLTIGISGPTAGSITRTAGMIVGPVKKWNAAATGSTVFPVGDGVNYKPATINFTTAPTAGTLTVNFSSPAPVFGNATTLTESAAVPPITVNKLSKQGSWFVDAGDGLTGGAYTASFTGNGATDIIDYTRTVLVKRPSSGGDWALENTYVATTGSNIAPVVSRTGLTSFSEFAIGGELNIALPLSLQYFTGAKRTAGNLLDWKITCTSGVTITLERSADKVNFKSLNAQSATADRCLTPFSYTDAQPLAGSNYYRLKLTSADGDSKYSNIVLLINKDKGFEFVNLVPNPVQHSAVLNMSSAKAGKVELSVSDVTGKVVMKQSTSVTAGSNQLTMNFANLAAGTYQITAVNEDGEIKTTRFVKY